MAGVKRLIAAGTFDLGAEFADYRFIRNMATATARRTCNQVFDEFLAECYSRVAKKDLAFVTGSGYVPQAPRANLATRDRAENLQ